MLIPAILVSIVALLAAMDEQLFGASMMARPLFTGPIIGLIMGDLQTGVIIGATLESMFMGSIMVGSAVPPEVYASSILSIAIAIQTGAGTGTAVALDYHCLYSCSCGETSVTRFLEVGQENRLKEHLMREI